MGFHDRVALGFNVGGIIARIFGIVLIPRARLKGNLRYSQSHSAQTSPNEPSNIQTLNPGP